MRACSGRLGTRKLRGELDTRYQAALAATLAPDVKRSEDVRYIWASEAKVQCGIAIGYLKTRTVDADSINKCDAFTARLSQVPPPPAPPLPPPPPPEPACSVPPVVSVFFDWDVDVPPADARLSFLHASGTRRGATDVAPAPTRSRSRARWSPP